VLTPAAIYAYLLRMSRQRRAFFADKCFLEPWMVRANLSKPCPTSKQEDVRQKCSVARQVLVLPCYSSFDVICHDVKALG